MTKKLLLAISLATTLAVTLTSLASAADPTAYVQFTTDAPCSVSGVSAVSYTTPANQPGPILSGSTPWTLSTYPGTSVEFSYPPYVVCGGITYKWASYSTSNPVISGTAGETVIVEGRYAIVDTVPPVVTVPADIVAEASGSAGAAVGFSATANDAVDGPITPTCTPASGSTFPVGTTPVTCTATDAHGNSASDSFNVTVVDATSPVIVVPDDIMTEAIGSAGAMVEFSATASDVVDGSITPICTPASGSTFPVGTTLVTCTATDAHGNSASDSFNVTVTDTTSPVVVVPDDIVIEAAEPTGTVVGFTATANDAVDGPIIPICTPASGSTFPVGTTPVTCTATDAYGNSASGTFNVTVTLDTIPPIIDVPDDIVTEATGPAGAVVEFSATASDAVDGVITPICVPASGSTFPVGTTLVTCTAADAHGNSASDSFNVTVTFDMTPPVLNLPSDIVVPALNASGAVVDYTVSADDLIDGPVPVICTPASGSLFPIGTTTVDCSATDSQGNLAQGSFTLSVRYAVGVECGNVPGHQVLQPINPDGSSIFQQGSTVPVKFRVCGADGNPIGTAGVVTDIRLISSDEAVISTSAHDTFRSGARQWIFNLSTSNLTAGNTYVYQIMLNDGSTIQFQFTLK